MAVRGRVVNVDFSKKSDLAYIKGVLCGDGWTYNNKKTWKYNVGLGCKDKEFALKFKASLEKIGLRMWFGYDEKHGWRTIGNSKLLYLWNENTNYDGFKTKKEITSFLEGFYESDGTSSLTNIQYCNTNKALLLATKKYLDVFDIETTLQGPYKNNHNSTYYFLRVKSKYINKFKTLINPINKFNKK